MNTGTHKPTASGNEFASLGARLVRLGHALQEPSTTVNELVALAMSSGINFKLRVVAESGSQENA